MIYKYLEFIKEGSDANPSNIYWNNSEYEKILKSDWSEILVKKDIGDYYKIRFRIGPDKYDYYAVIFQLNNKNDIYLLEDEIDINVFIEKFKNEFWKNAPEYAKDMKYVPKCLGDISHVRAATKYNL
jgi:hypothetical protein